MLPNELYQKILWFSELRDFKITEKEGGRTSIRLRAGRAGTLTLSGSYLSKETAQLKPIRLCYLSYL